VSTAPTKQSRCASTRRARSPSNALAELLGTDPPPHASSSANWSTTNPVPNRLVPAAEYLSGNVRAKLDTCRAIDDPDGRFRANIAALERVLPRQLEPTEITARLGAPWIPSRDIEQFCREVLDATVDVEHLPQLGNWSARLRDGSRRSVALSSEWGTAVPTRSHCSTPR
jgi:hypothetical protein